MPNVRWGDLASAEAGALSQRLRRGIDERLDHLEAFPEMYPLVHVGRYRGCRHFTVDGQVTVYYRVFPGTLDCFVVAVKPARRQPE